MNKILLEVVEFAVPAAKRMCGLTPHRWVRGDSDLSNKLCEPSFGPASGSHGLVGARQIPHCAACQAQHAPCLCVSHHLARIPNGGHSKWRLWRTKVWPNHNRILKMSWQCWGQNGTPSTRLPIVGDARKQPAQFDGGR